MVLEAVYEQDFLPCSYGFRPGRSAHQALQALRTGFMSHGLRCLDIEKYFGASGQAWRFPAGAIPAPAGP